MRDVDVLIVGAGPAGLTCAIELARRDVSFRIIDKVGPRPRAESRATAIHARTFELWEPYGIVETLTTDGAYLAGISAYTEGGRFARAIVEGVESHWGFSVMYPQSETERLLFEHLETFGHSVERPVELVSFKHDADGVDAVVRDAAGAEESLRCKYLLGCDGGRSAVRKQLGLNFAGKELRGAFLMDCIVDWPGGDFEDAGQNYLSCGKDLIMWQNPGGMTRIVVSLPKSDPRMVTHTPTIEEMQAFVDEEGIGAKLIGPPQWATSLYISNRMVDKWRDGRAFLVGDAAHIHDPTGGQGMNTGVLDAFNIAWKLDLALRGYGGPGLLDTYESERKPNVEVLLKAVERAAATLTAKRELTARMRVRAVGLAATTKKLNDLGRTSVAGFRVTYKGPLVSEQRASLTSRLRGKQPVPWASRRMFKRFGPAPGKRAADVEGILDLEGERRLLQTLGSDTRHTLLVFQGITTDGERLGELRKLVAQVAERHGDLIRPLLVAGRPAKPDEQTVCDLWMRAIWRYGARHDCLYLIRPDGYVGFRSQPADLEALQSYLEQAFPYDGSALVSGQRSEAGAAAV